VRKGLTFRLISFAKSFLLSCFCSSSAFLSLFSTLLLGIIQPMEVLTARTTCEPGEGPTLASAASLGVGA